MKRLIAPGALLLAALTLRILARAVDGFSDGYLRVMNAFWVNTLGRFSSLFPFSLVEWLIVLLLLGVLFGAVFLTVRRLQKKEVKKQALNYLCFLLSVGALIFFLYEAGEDVYFYATPFSQRHGFARREYSTEELYAVCEGLAEKVNQTAALVPRDADGHMQNEADLPRRVQDAVAKLGDRYPEFAGYVPRGKTIFFSYAMDKMLFSGIYSAYTSEANINGDMPAYNSAYSMSHELAHTKGVLPEIEANFVAYLACIDHADADIAYSGAMLALTYCGNELNRRDKQAWAAIVKSLDPRADEDLRDNRLFWEQYKGKASEVTEALNDAFLISHGQTEGVQSYDRVVDLIVVSELQASQE